MDLIVSLGRIRKFWFYIILLSFMLILFTSCGGDDEIEEESEGPSDAYLAALAAAESGDSGQVLDTTNSDSTLNSPTPVPTQAPVIINSKEQAELMLWEYLITCREMDTEDITSHSIDSTSGDKEYSVYPDSSAKNKFGVWKINEREGKLTPQNNTAKLWDDWIKSGLEDTVQRQCDSVLEKEIPKEITEPVVTSSREASVVVWTYLSKCYPELDDGYLDANENKNEGGFVVKTSPGYKTDHGLWNVKQDGTLSAMNEKANERAAEVTSGQCKNLIKSDTEAISAIWSYIVKCNPLLDINDLDANWDPKEDDWVVITKKSAQTRSSNPEPDHGIWRISRDAQITADNITAQTEKIRADQGTEKC